jgi:predicted ATPase
MGHPIKEITIEGFKSIRQLDAFPLGSLNVLIGANGAGKSNFIEFFRLVRAIVNHGLQRFVNLNGGADPLFHMGPKVTPVLQGVIRLGERDGYEFQLEPSVNNEVVLTQERARIGLDEQLSHAVGYRESQVLNQPSLRFEPPSPAENGAGFNVIVSGWSVYHFHDTSDLAPMRRDQSVRDDYRIRPDGGNIAAYLLRLQTVDPPAYRMVRDVVRLVLPAFDDFRLRARDRGDNGDEQVRLEWGQRGNEYTFQPFQLSDGTIRFICLATALLQPNPPATVVFDEPELGLHPHALGLLAGLLRKAAHRTQVIVATQSSTLVSEFEPEDIVVVSRQAEASTFRRVGAGELTAFLADYSLGELWQKNYIDGASNG